MEAAKILKGTLITNTLVANYYKAYSIKDTEQTNEISIQMRENGQLETWNQTTKESKMHDTWDTIPDALQPFWDLCDKNRELRRQQHERFLSLPDAKNSKK